MTQPQPHERLDVAMNERRLELRMNWREVATAAGVSYEALRAVRRGDYRPTELTARGLDEALRWVPGSVLAILNGGLPVTLESAQGDEAASLSGDGQAEEGPTLSRELRLAERLLAATVRELNLSPQEADQVWQQVRLEIEATHRSHEGKRRVNDRNERAG